MECDRCETAGISCMMNDDNERLTFMRVGDLVEVIRNKIDINNCMLSVLSLEVIDKARESKVLRGGLLNLLNRPLDNEM